jgi:transposase
MIPYELYCQIRLYHGERGLSFAQIARELHLDPETVAKWALAKSYRARLHAPRKSKLDPYKATIQRLLEHHPYTATQIFQRLRAEHAYGGGMSILKDYVRKVRPVRAPAFLTPLLRSGRMRASRLGQRRLLARRVHYPPAFFLCHGALS